MPCGKPECCWYICRNGWQLPVSQWLPEHINRNVLGLDAPFLAYWPADRGNDIVCVWHSFGMQFMTIEVSLPGRRLELRGWRDKMPGQTPDIADSFAYFHELMDYLQALQVLSA